MSKGVIIWLAAVVAGIGIPTAKCEETSADSGISRERNLRHLEGSPPPALVAERWMNTPGMEALSLDQLKGKIVLIDFWGTWCAPCRATIPHLKDLHDAFADDGLVILGIHSTQDSRGMERFVKQNGIPYPVAVDRQKKTWKAYQGDSYPDYYLIDQQGILRFADLETTAISPAIVLLLKEAAESVN